MVQSHQATSLFLSVSVSLSVCLSVCVHFFPPNTRVQAAGGWVEMVLTNIAEDWRVLVVHRLRDR